MKLKFFENSSVAAIECRYWRRSGGGTEKRGSQEGNLPFVTLILRDAVLALDWPLERVVGRTLSRGHFNRIYPRFRYGSMGGSGRVKFSTPVYELAILVAGCLQGSTCEKYSSEQKLRVNY